MTAWLSQFCQQKVCWPANLTNDAPPNKISHWTHISRGEGWVSKQCQSTHTDIASAVRNRPTLCSQATRFPTQWYIWLYCICMINDNIADLSVSQKYNGIYKLLNRVFLFWTYGFISVFTITIFQHSPVSIPHSLDSTVVCIHFYRRPASLSMFVDKTAQSKPEHDRITIEPKTILWDRHTYFLWHFNTQLHSCV